DHWHHSGRDSDPGSDPAADDQAPCHCRSSRPAVARSRGTLDRARQAAFHGFPGPHRLRLAVMDNGFIPLTDLHRLIVGLIGMLPALARATTWAVGIMIILPVFSRISFGGLLRAGLALALAIPIVDYANSSLADLQRPARTVQLCLLAGKEVFVG